MNLGRRSDPIGEANFFLFTILLKSVFLLGCYLYVSVSDAVFTNDGSPFGVSSQRLRRPPPSVERVGVASHRRDDSEVRIEGSGVLPTTKNQKHISNTDYTLADSPQKRPTQLKEK